MSPNPANVIAAYSNTARAAIPSGDTQAAPRDDFAKLVETTAENALSTAYKAEQVTAQGLSGNADLTQVVTAVSNAEVTLQTVVAVRDKVVSAYQEILRMPI